MKLNEQSYAYRLGYDCGKYGPNQTNCYFGVFNSPESTREWERGKRDAELETSPDRTLLEEAAKG